MLDEVDKHVQISIVTEQEGIFLHMLKKTLHKIKLAEQCLVREERTQDACHEFGENLHTQITARATAALQFK